MSGRGLRRNGPHHRIQQRAPEQSEQPAQAAGTAGDRGSAAAEPVEAGRMREPSER